MVWVKAVILAPKEKEVHENEWERRNRERKSRDQAHNNRSDEHESREHILTHLNELATKAQILIKVRDRFDSHCHDWKRRSRDYLENQRKHDQREPAEIQQEFRRIFEEEVALDRASVLGAREAYLNAQSRAKKAGISDRCLGYVESIDLHSEDSEEIRKADRSALKEVPQRLNRPRGYVIDRELYPPAHRVKGWINNVKSVGSVPEDKLDQVSSPKPAPQPESAPEKTRLSQRSDHERDVGTDSLYGMRRPEVKAPGTREMLSKSPLCYNPEQGPAPKPDTSRDNRRSHEERDSNAASRIEEVPKEQSTPKDMSSSGAASLHVPNLEPPRQQSGDAQRARINESTERELLKQSAQGPVVNTWRPETGITFVKTAAKKYLGVGKELPVPSTNEGTGESRIDEVRRLLSEQGDRVPRKQSCQRCR
jgi:hypothetical protein